MIVLSDKHTTISTDSYKAIKLFFELCGFGNIPVKDVRFIGFIKGDYENDKN